MDVQRRLLTTNKAGQTSDALSAVNVREVSDLNQHGLSAIVHDEVLSIIPCIHEAVAFAVRKEFTPIEALVERLATWPLVVEAPDARRAVDEKKEAKKVTINNPRTSVPQTPGRIEEGLAEERFAEWAVVMREDLKGDVRRIMREELHGHHGQGFVHDPHGPPGPGVQERWKSSPLPPMMAGDLYHPETSPSPPPPPPPPNPSPVHETPIVAPVHESPKGPRIKDASSNIYVENKDDRNFATMQTTELHDFVQAALEDPCGVGAAEFQEEFQEALDNPKIMEAAIFKLLPRWCCARWLRPCVHWLLNLEEPKRSGAVNDVVHHHKFEFVCNLVIVLNAVYAAYTADWEMKNLNQTPDMFMKGAELSFMSVYLVELILKLIVHRLYFFCNKEWTWNNFDFLLVMLSVYEQVMELAGIGSGSSVTFMRIFRLLKLSKILRLFRALKFLQELRLMMAAIGRTMSALFWAMVMVSFFFFIFGLVMLQGLTGYLSEATLEGTLDPLIAADIDEKFGSMTNSMLTLYMVTTGGDDWGNAYNTVAHAGGLYSACFLFYIAFFCFAVFNILTGMIVENVSGLAGQDEEAAVLSYRREKQEVAEEARNLFLKLDEDGSGQITQSEFELAMNSDQMHALMSAMDLDVQDGRMFFEILCAASSSDSVSVSNFINGCMRMKGTSTAIDMQSALMEIRTIHKKLDALRDLDSDGLAHAGPISTAL